MDAKAIPTFAGTPRRLARQYPWGYERHYAYWKLLLDPVYEATFEQLSGSSLPLLDIGCGPGLLAACLRRHGFTAPIHGVDYDVEKVALTQQAFGSLPQVSFMAADARRGLPDHHGHVTMLDTIQFFQPGELQLLLERSAARVAPGGKLIIRTALRDESWQFRLSRVGDWFAKVTRWMKAHASNYPARGEIVPVLEAAGLTGSIRRLTGSIPFNNFLLVFQRPK
jgi:SAM-dependent methyltransferase